MARGEFLDVGGDKNGVNLSEPDVPFVAPFEEPRGGSGIGRPRVRVPDVRREEFDEAASCSFASLGDDGGENESSALPCDFSVRRWDKFGAHSLRVPLTATKGQKPI